MLDGKHFKINALYNSGLLFYNYKEHFVIVLMDVADADYKFLYANVECKDLFQMAEC